MKLSLIIMTGIIFLYMQFGILLSMSSYVTNGIFGKYDNTDYNPLMQCVTEFKWNILKRNDINIYAINVTSKLLE